MKDIVFFCYPKCSTCQKAKKWLQENSVEFTERDIVKNNPTEAELKKFYKKSKKELGCEFRSLDETLKEVINWYKENGYL